MIDLNALPLDALFAELTRDGFLRRLLELARDEDLGPGGVPGDVTSLATIGEDVRGEARVAARGAGVICGARTLPELLRVFAPSVSHRVHIEDAGRVERGDVVATLSGPLRQILAVERTLLNLMSRLSGIASLTAAHVQAIEGTGAKLLDTRKTTPGLRAMEKYAVRCGGGHCHRIGLFDAVLIKDNHIAHVGLEDLPRFIGEAIGRARELAQKSGYGGGLRFVEMEVDTLEQFERVLGAGLCEPGHGLDVALLDNMSVEQLHQAVAMRARHGSNVLLECSGGVTMRTIRAIAETGVDRISVGALTHQAVSMDLGLDIA